MEAAVDQQPAGELAIGQEGLTEHLGQEDGGGVVVAQAGHLDGQLEPVGARGGRTGLSVRVVLLIVVVVGVVGGRSRGLDFGLDAHHGLGPVGETDAGAAIGARQDARLGAERPELRRRPTIRPHRRLQRERAVQVGQLGGREEHLVRRHGARLQCPRRHASALFEETDWLYLADDEESEMADFGANLFSFRNLLSVSSLSLFSSYPGPSSLALQKLEKAPGYA